MDEYKEHLDEIAQAAAELYGRDWQQIYGVSRDVWRETVRHTLRGGGGSTEIERCAGKAIDEWYKKQEAAAETAPAVVEKKARKKSEVKDSGDSK